MLTKRWLLVGVSVLACARQSGAPAGDIRHAAEASTDASADAEAQVRLIDDQCRDVTLRARRAEISAHEIDGLEIDSVGRLDDRIRLATGTVTVGENLVQVTMCYRPDGSLAKATKEVDAVEHSMGERNRQLEATVVRYFDPQGGLLQITGTKKLSEVQGNAVLEEGPVTERDVAPDADSILASFDHEARLVMHAAQLGSG